MKKKLFICSSVLLSLLVTSCNLINNKVIYDVNFILNNEIIETISVSKGEKIDSPESSLIKEGYIVNSWYILNDNDKTTLNFNEYIVNSNLNIYADFSYKEYKIIYHLDGGINNDNNPSKFTMVDDDLYLYPASKEGYNFYGWYSNQTYTTAISKISKGITKDIDVYARWVGEEHDLYVSTIDSSKGTVSILSGSPFTGSKIVIEAKANDGYVFSGWYSDDVLISKDSKYTFIMPDNDYSLVAKFLIKDN